MPVGRPGHFSHLVSRPKRLYWWLDYVITSQRVEGRELSVMENTTDAMHLLANTIKASWRAGQVTATLPVFL